MNPSPLFNKPILILGSTGQLGFTLKKLCPYPFLALTRKELDLSQPTHILSQLNSIPCSAIINAAAYTQVDLAEKEKTESLNVNAHSPKILAEYCKNKNIPFIHFSTDYVFNGQKKIPYTEEDRASPINFYGESKWIGEKHIQNISPSQYAILRTSWVYYEKFKNFPTAVLKLLSDKEQFNMVSDQIGSPTYTSSLAQAAFETLKQLLISPEKSGLYHYSSRNSVSRFEMTKKIKSLLDEFSVPYVNKEILPILTSELNSPIKRPLYSFLSTEKIQKVFQIIPPIWEEDLKLFLKAYL